MIVNAAVQEIISLRPGDEIVVANQEEYYNDTFLEDSDYPPKDSKGNRLLYSEVLDIVKENGKLIFLVK